MKPPATLRIATVMALGVIVCFATSAAQAAGVVDESCPKDAIPINPGDSIQAAVDTAGADAKFCLRNGVHRMQVVRPKAGQSFYGEGQTVLNGSRLLTQLVREGRYWVASNQNQRGERHGECNKNAPACDLPEAVFVDDKPLRQALSYESLKRDEFFLDRTTSRLYLAVDDVQGRKVEASVGAFAFGSFEPNVLVRNLTIEKYSSVAQKGAIQAQDASGWAVENCDVFFNSGAGIAVGSDGRVSGSNVHENGQIGIKGVGRNVVIENNQVWGNNIHGFDPAWEAGGVKMSASDGVIFRSNAVHDNIGAGLWCDIGCRNVLYEKNVVEGNRNIGIFHEISFKAIIRDNVVRGNGLDDRGSFWATDIVVAASQDVEAYGNMLSESEGICGIMLVDQSRSMEGGGKYKTRNNYIHNNEMTFEGSPCSGGVSDAHPGDENFAIITEGDNNFDQDVYRAAKSAAAGARFAWGHAEVSWEEFRALGQETNGQLVAH
jgi:Right handed beta helix region